MNDIKCRKQVDIGKRQAAAAAEYYPIKVPANFPEFKMIQTILCHNHNN